MSIFLRDYVLNLIQKRAPPDIKKGYQPFRTKLTVIQKTLNFFTYLVFGGSAVLEIPELDVPGSDNDLIRPNAANKGPFISGRKLYAAAALINQLTGGRRAIPATAVKRKRIHRMPVTVT